MHRINLFKQNKNQYGFTLIELLVVVSIIGLLSTIVLVGLSVARVKGRNTARLSEYKAVSKALESYRNDVGNYPPTNGWACLGPVVPAETCYYGYFSGDATLVAALTPYISRMPKTFISQGSGMNHPIYYSYLDPSYKFIIIYWFYEGTLSPCPQMFADTPPNAPFVWDTGTYTCYDFFYY